MKHIYNKVTLKKKENPKRATHILDTLYIWMDDYLQNKCYINLPSLYADQSHVTPWRERAETEGFLALLTPVWSEPPEGCIPATRHPNKCHTGAHIPDFPTSLPSPRKSYSVTHYLDSRWSFTIWTNKTTCRSYCMKGSVQGMALVPLGCYIFAWLSELSQVLTNVPRKKAKSSLVYMHIHGYGSVLSGGVHHGFP